MTAPACDWCCVYTIQPCSHYLSHNIDEYFFYFFNVHLCQKITVQRVRYTLKTDENGNALIALHILSESNSLAKDDYFMKIDFDCEKRNIFCSALK